uniref:Uncharacterized protein n=1 Tax=uncultured bacterium 9F08 TaxID=697051 RepID=D2XIR5_9BACT|nr:hypothetical protein [uncultured bacterium 9F08]
MGGHPQDTLAQLGLKAVHHRQYSDQRRHPQRDAQHRGQGDKGDKVITALGTGVAQADKELKWSVHGDALNHN